MEDLNSTRESEKHGLNYYLEDYDFIDFEETVGEIINALEKKLNNLSDDLEKAIEAADNEDKYNNTFFIGDDMFSVEDELFLIYELVILNDYKEFETILKKLLKVSLNFRSRDLNRHDTIKSRLKDKKIDITKFDNYQAVEELREVNNHIKHSTILNTPDALNKILEFKDKSKLDFRDLRNFHQRIFKSRVSYIFELKNKIYEYLYVFNESRILNFAQTIIKRLNSNQVDMLIKNLKALK